MLMDMSFQMLDEQADATAHNTGSVQDRQIALMLLSDFWRTRPDIIQSKETKGRTAEGIQ